MKLIIDIPEEGYKKLKEYFAKDNCGLPTDLFIAKGIPLEKIKEEIKEKAKEHIKYADYGRRENGLYEALEIIDKYISELKGSD